MNSKEEVFVGIDLCYSEVQIHLFNTNGNCLDTFTIFNNFLSPGEFTVVLTKRITLIQHSYQINFITIFIPGVLDHEKRRVESLQGIPSWSEVPLVDWLEIRLKTKVLLIRKTSISLRKDLSAYFLEIKSNYSDLCEQTVLL